MPVFVYNLANIALWRQTIPALQATMHQNHQLVHNQSLRIPPIQAQLSSFQSQINAVQSDIQILEHERYVRNHCAHTHHYDHGHYHHHHHYTTGDLVWGFAGDMLYNSRISSLRNQLNGLLLQRAPLVSTLEQINRTIENSKAEANTAQFKLNELVKYINEAEQFLEALKNRPHTLIEGLRNSISNQFALYAKNHPTNLSSEIRLCLDNLDEKLAVFSVSKDIKKDQSTYLKLAAFIYNMQEKTSSVDPKFRTILDELVNQTHLISDLPDEFAIGISLQDHYSAVAKAHPELFNKTAEQLSQQEEAVYQNLKKGFPCALVLGGNQTLTKHINAAYSSMNKEIDYKQSKNQPIDYHFYNQVTQLLLELNKNPLNQEASKQLTLLTKHAAGKPSVGKKVLGALGIVLGVALIITGLVMMGLICANCPPLALGLGLAVQGLVAAVTALVGISSGLGAAFFGREALMGKDLYRSLSSVNKEIHDNKPKPM